MLFRTVLAHGDGEWEEPGTLLPLLYTCNMSGKLVYFILLLGHSAQHSDRANYCLPL